MMLASQIRANARESLQNKWGKAALISLVFMVASFFLSLLTIIPMIGGLAVTVISVPLSYGLVATFIKLKRNEDVTYTTFLSEGFANFGKVWSVTLWTALKLLPWIILIIVAVILMAVSGVSLALGASASGSGLLVFVAFVAYIVAIVMLVIKGFAYAMSYFILYDNPTLAGKEIVEKSAVIMQNNKWRYFCLNLSFIGWVFLAGFTFGIGMLWLLPYIQVAAIHFYEDLLGKISDEKKEETTVEDKKDEDDGNAITEK